MKTTFQAITDLGTFTRTSESHNAERPFTHVVLIQRMHTGTKWFAHSWCGSRLLADARMHHLLSARYFTMPYASAALVVEAEITAVSKPRT